MPEAQNKAYASYGKIHSPLVREPDPTLTMLRECVLESEADDGTPDEIKARIQDVMHFLDTLNTWYAQIRGMPRPVLIKLIKLGAKIQRFVGQK